MTPAELRPLLRALLDTLGLDEFITWMCDNAECDVWLLHALAVMELAWQKECV